MYSRFGRETGRQGPRLSRGVAGPSRQGQQKMGKRRWTWWEYQAKLESPRSPTRNKYVSQRSCCNTNRLWQIGTENKFIERLLGSSQNYWEDWLTRLKNGEDRDRPQMQSVEARQGGHHCPHWEPRDSAARSTAMASTGPGIASSSGDYIIKYNLSCYTQAPWKPSGAAVSYRSLSTCPTVPPRVCP